MAKTGLLILTHPLAHIKSLIPQVVKEASAVVSDTLYVYLQPALHTQKATPSSLLHPVALTKEVEACLTHFYSSVSSVCHTLDVRVLLSHICTNTSKYTATPYPLQNSVSLLLCDSPHVKATWQASQAPLTDALRSSFTNVDPNLGFHFLSLGDSAMEPSSDNSSSEPQIVQTYPNVCLGGTFDRLHDGHKLLLSQSCLVCDKKLTIGITDGDKNKRKSLWELMQPYAEREQQVVSFVSDIKPSIKVEPVQIFDSFGPTITEPDLHCLVVSLETAAGGQAVHEERKKRNFPPMDTVTVDLVDDACRVEGEEEKVSSSSKRKRLLGNLLHPLNCRPQLPVAPYRIGLVGGIASGKSRLCSVLQSHGAMVVDCDLLGHRAYVKGTEAYSSLIKEFGADIVGDDGEIDRKRLGAIVFSDKSKLQMLNSIVWPAIRDLAEAEIQAATSSVVVMEAAILIEAGWDDMVHEVWTTFISREEAVQRIMARNNLSQEAAEKRIDSQLSNEERIQRSNVVICSQWEVEETDKQIEKAWTLLQHRVKASQAKL